MIWFSIVLEWLHLGLVLVRSCDFVRFVVVGARFEFGVMLEVLLSGCLGLVVFGLFSGCDYL